MKLLAIVAVLFTVASATRTAATVDPMEAIESQLSTLLDRVNTIGDQVNNMNTRLAKIGPQLRAHTDRMNRLAKDINEDRKDIRVLNRSVNKTVKATEEMSMSVEEQKESLVKKEDALELISNQLMQQQTFVEERIRTLGTSGIKAVRSVRQGTSPYYGNTFIGNAAEAAHDHADYDRTLGLGEMAAVINGVDFRSRHNDYKFVKPTSTPEYNAVEDIPFPDMPPEVLEKPTLQEQIVELRQWFKAFKEQNHTVRDYRKYFKPNLCYLEAGWTLSQKMVSEPFKSDRHFIDAASWFELQQKNRYTAYDGSKDNKENLAYLPTIMYEYEDGVPKMAQWNYRILCHPLKEDLPTAYFDVQDDLSIRLSRGLKWENLAEMREARFKLNEFGTQRFIKTSLIDKIMGEIPGKDNYGANLTASTFDLLNYDVTSPPNNNKVLNVGYYHRFYKLLQPSAMGIQSNARGFRDGNLWVAMTTQPNIIPISMQLCNRYNRRLCKKVTTRVTYALPMEIVYSTPVQGWNPYDLPYYEDRDTIGAGRELGYRNGGLTPDFAYNGTSHKHFYRCPAEFFQARKKVADKADTGRIAVGVLDKQGNVQKVAPSGFRVTTEAIDGVGKVRTRYPIFPAHSEGTIEGMELQALKEMVMKMSRYANLYETSPFDKPQDVEEPVTFEMTPTYKDPPGLHIHTVTLSAEEHKRIMTGRESVTTLSSYALGHQHEVEVRYYAKEELYYIKTCDGADYCWDGHFKRLNKIS